MDNPRRGRIERKWKKSERVKEKKEDGGFLFGLFYSKAFFFVWINSERCIAEVFAQTKGIVILKLGAKNNLYLMSNLLFFFRIFGERHILNVSRKKAVNLHSYLWCLIFARWMHIESCSHQRDIWDRCLWGHVSQKLFLTWRLPINATVNESRRFMFI